MRIDQHCSVLSSNRSLPFPEAIRADRLALWLDRLLQDLRSAARNATKYPITWAAAILSIGAGIDATTAALTVRNAVFHNGAASVSAPRAAQKSACSFAVEAA